MAGNTETRRINVFINSELAGASLKSLKTESRKLYNELANLTPGTDAFIKKSKELKIVEGRLGDIKSEIKGTASAIEGLPGPLGAATQGVMGLAKQFLALLMNPVIATIAAIAVALMGLYKAFMKTDEGATMMEGGMKVLAIIMDKLIGFALKIGKYFIDAFENPQQALKDFVTLIKEQIINRFVGLLELIPQLGKAMGQLFSGDFKAATKTAFDAAAKVGLGIENITDKLEKSADEIKRLAKEGIAMAKAFDDLNDRERDFSVIASKNETQIQKLILASKNRTKTDQERIDMLNEASKLEKENFNTQKGFAEERLKLIQRENAEAVANRKLDEVNASLSDEEVQKEIDAINKIEELNRGSIELQEKIKNREDVLIDSRDAEKQKAFEKDQKRIEKETALREKQLNDFEALSKKELENTLKILDDEVNQEQNKLKQAFANKEITITEYNDRLSQLKLDALNKELKDLEDYALTVEGVDLKIAAKKTEIANLTVDAQIAANEKLKKYEKELTEARLGLAETFINGFSELLAQDEANRKRFGVVLKALALAEIGINLSRELSAIAVAAAANPTNAVTFGAAGVSQYTIQSITAIVRSAFAVAKVVSQKFAKGGSTFAPGGSVNKPFLAMAGEAGPEWIAPNWMLRHPVYADVIGSLENVRARGFASGGTTSSTPTPAFNASSSLPSAEQNQTNDLLLTAINQLINRLDKPAVAVISYDQMVNSMDEINAIKSNASIGK